MQEKRYRKQNNSDTEKNVKSAKLAQKIAILQLIKNACDVVTASDSLAPPAEVFGLQYNEKFCSMCGLVCGIVDNICIYLNLTHA